MNYLFTTCIAAAIAVLIPATAGARGIPFTNTFTNTTELLFIENKGQVTDQDGTPRPDIDVKVEGGGMNIFVGDGAIHYQWYDNLKAQSKKSKKEEPGLFPFNHQRIQAPTTTETYRMDVTLLGADTNAELIKEEAQSYYETYYTSTTGENGAIMHSYKRVVYKNVYPHIDWVLYSKGGQLKYDFVIHPGGDVANIKLQYGGATHMELRDGALTATTPMGSITEAAPYSYDALTRVKLESRYILEGNSLRYEVQGGAVNGVVIDPTLNWATYYGGSGNETSQSVTTDTAGNPYIAGTTQSSGNIATTGSYQQSIGGGSDGFLAKLNDAGVRQWATYYGGTGTEEIHSAAADGLGNIYIGGSTTSPSNSGLASAGSHQPTYTGNTGSTGLLVKFNNSGQRVWATYYANGAGLEIQAVACDAGNNISISGTCWGSTIGVASPGAWQTSPGFFFLARFNNSGVRLWGTFFFNGNIGGRFTGMSCDGFGNTYICGFTNSVTGVSTAGSHQPVYGGGGADGYLAKFSAGGIQEWATYYGGGDQDYLRSIYADAAGNVYAGGISLSANIANVIATPGAYQTALVGGSGMILKFNSNGIRQWGTYYGGNYSINITGLEVGPDGYLYCAGTAGNTSTNITTVNAHQGSYGGNQWDAMMCVMSADGMQRVYGTYYGGSGNEVNINTVVGGYPAIHCSRKGRVYLCGVTSSPNNIATVGSYQTALGGGFDAFIAQFDTDTAVFLEDYVVTIQQLCVGDSLKVPYGVTHPFRPGNVFTLQLSNNVGSFATPVSLATKTTQFGDTFKLIVPVLTSGSGYRVRVIASLKPDTTDISGVDINVSSYPAKPIATATGPACTGQLISFDATGVTGTVTWGWTGPDNFSANIKNPGLSNPTLLSSGDYVVVAENNGCARKDTVTVSVGQSPAAVVAGNNSPICTGQTLNLTATCATPGVTWSWAGPISVPQVQNPGIPIVTLAANGSYTATATLGNCSSNSSTTAVVNQGPAVGMYVSPNDTICNGTVATFVAVPANVGPSPAYQWLKNSQPVIGQTGLTWATSALVTGDVIAFTVSNVPSCNVSAVSSQPITMTVVPVITTPSVTITSVPAQPLPGNAATFTAIVMNGGPNPQYQWQRNGIDQPGATNATWSTNNLYPYDKISVSITSNDPCANIKTATSNEIEVNFPTGITNVNGSLSFHIYPNPNDGRFTLKGKVKGDEPLEVQLTNAIGQTVYRATIQSKNGNVEHTISVKVAAGIYLLKAGNEVVRMVVE